MGAGPVQKTAPILVRLFAIDGRLAAQIASAAPIVLVSGLSAGQAEGVRAALGELAAAGVEIKVQSGDLGTLPQVGWPGVPKIAGRPATEHVAPPAATAGRAGPGAGPMIRCPACGATFRLAPDGAPQAAAPAAAAPAPAAGARRPPSAVNKETFGFEEVPLPEELREVAPAAASRPPAPADLPDVPELPSAPASKPPPSAPAPPASPPKSSVLPMALEDFEAGLAHDESLLADLDDGLPQVPEEKPRPVPIKPVTAKPVKDSGNISVEPLAPGKTPVRAPAGSRPPSARPMTPQQAARHALAGKAGGKPVAKPAAKPVAKPSAAPRPPTAPPAPAPAAAPAGDPGEKCNVFATGSNNPKLAELLSKIRGVPLEQAQELATKTVITVARNISRDKAEIIRRKFVEHRISVRVAPAGQSQRTSPPADGG